MEGARISFAAVARTSGAASGLYGRGDLIGNDPESDFSVANYNKISDAAVDGVIGKVTSDGVSGRLSVLRPFSKETRQVRQDRKFWKTERHRQRQAGYSNKVLAQEFAELACGFENGRSFANGMVDWIAKQRPSKRQRYAEAMNDKRIGSALCRGMELLDRQHLIELDGVLRGETR